MPEHNSNQTKLSNGKKFAIFMAVVILIILISLLIPSNTQPVSNKPTTNKPPTSTTTSTSTSTTTNKLPTTTTTSTANNAPLTTINVAPIMVTPPLVTNQSNTQITTTTNKCISGTDNYGNCPNLTSDHCKTKMEDNGILSIYSKGVKIWDTKISSNQLPVTSVMQPDGNFVLYDKNRFAIWSTNTWGKGVKPYNITLQDDCNLVLYDSTHTPLWASGTNGK